MTYTKVFEPSRYESIASATDQLSRLSPGQRIVIQAKNAEALVRLRYLLYDYLYHTGLKGDFRLKVISPTELLILRLQSALIEKIESERSAPFIERLIDLWDSGDPGAELAKWVEKGELTQEEAKAVKEEVERIMR